MGKTLFIKKARRIRKVFGGGMRQAGFMAAAGIYAFQHNIERLACDHEAAKRIEKALSEKDFIAEIMPAETNIVIAETKLPAREIAARLGKEGLKVIAISPMQIRFVTHLDISPEMMNEAIEIIGKL
jgi:threonine aldolase